MMVVVRCDRCGYGGTAGAIGSNGLCPLCGGKMREIDYSKSFVVKKGWFVNFVNGGMERIVIRQLTLPAFI